MENFTVLMSVYKKDNPFYVKKAIESITKNQTLLPQEVIIIVDGPVKDNLLNVIKSYETESTLYKIIWLKENRGLGNALRIGVEKASNEIIARMDSDDVAHPNRFEKQISFLKANPNCDLVGGQITEFIGDENNIVGTRQVPTANNEIYRWMRQRCPFNHMTVMFKKSKILETGNYIDWHYNEDYYLWIRMALASMTFANLPDTLVNVRVGEEMYKRRGGWAYFKSEKGIQDFMLKKKLISLPRYIFNVTIRFIVQVAIPNNIRGFIFQKLFRK